MFEEAFPRLHAPLYERVIWSVLWNTHRVMAALRIMRGDKCGPGPCVWTLAKASARVICLVSVMISCALTATCRNIDATAWP